MPRKQPTPPTSTKPAKQTTSETPERATIPAQYKWNTTHLYANDEAWETELKQVKAGLPSLEQYKGKLKQGPKVIRSCLERMFAVQKQLTRLSNYANRLYDQDTRQAKYQGLKQRVEKLATDYLEAVSFLRPELLSLPAQQIEALIADKRSSDYNQYLRDLLRSKPHILSPAEEKLLASTSLMRDAGYNTYSTFTGADLKFPTIQDEEGRPVELTQALFVRYRAAGSRPVRKATYDAFFGTFDAYKNTIAGLLGSQINANIVFGRARNYKSALEAALDDNNVPTSVYHNMITAVGKYLPTLHRYLRLRQKLLGLKDLRYYDLYPPMIKKVDLRYDYDEARQLLVQALQPMGEEYITALKQGLDPQQGWIDAFPNKGKRSGAYMEGSAYDVHPYVLCNYLGDYNSVSTLAHEMGHAMHSYFSNKNQPYAKADYPIFVAEVASTLNEALLTKHMLRAVKDPKQRLFLLGEQLEGFRQTVFRQTMFAEFELALYERAERKEALTADEISKIYLEIARRYYGHDQQVALIDDPYAVEWAYVPHFYYNYYVFQYVTGMTAATALAEMIEQGGVAPRERYVTHLLKAGRADYPIELLKRAGVDLTTVAPYDVAMAAFTKALNQAEALVASMGGRARR